MAQFVQLKRKKKTKTKPVKYLHTMLADSFLNK